MNEYAERKAFDAWATNAQASKTIKTDGGKNSFAAGYAAGVAAERERQALLTKEQIVALALMLDHYKNDPRVACLLPLVRKSDDLADQEPANAPLVARQVRRLRQKLDKRDEKIAGMKRRIQELEHALAVRVEWLLQRERGFC